MECLLMEATANIYYMYACRVVIPRKPKHLSTLARMSIYTYTKFEFIQQFHRKINGHSYASKLMNTML